MYIKKIKLKNFRNYSEQEIELSENINIIYGDNAQGKTNIIEAIFLCAMGKSFRDKKEKDLIKFNESFSKISVFYKKMDREGKIEVEISDKKTFYINDIKQKKVRDVIGKINVVIFTPDDIEIMKEGPQRRRKFLDMMISPIKPKYISILSEYNKIIEQRNEYLKQINIENKERNILDIWDEQLSACSEEIYKYRKDYTDKIREKIEYTHNLIVEDKKEEIKIKYISNGDSKEKFLENLKKTRELDIKRGFTQTGIHRDDIIIYINGKQVSIFGSQGQQRTVVLTLKLCEINIVKEEIGEDPILLLDDFMSELDGKRKKRFLENIKGKQVIITCTDRIKIKNDSKVFLIEKGKIVRE